MIIHKNISFLKYNTLHLNNKIKIMFEVENSYDIYILIYLFNYFNLKYFVIGNGSKVLFKDEIVNEPIILINYKFSELVFLKGKIMVSSGYKLSNLIINMSNYNYGGFHNLFPIPACVGGAIYMNAGDNINDISNYVLDVICLNKEGKVVNLNNYECKFSYRNSIFKSNNYIILYAILRYDYIKKNLILNDIKNIINYRKNHQDISLYTCGSLFKNTINYKSYELIKKTNSKSLNINGAHLSLKHCNFLINDGNARAKDIIKLIDIIRNEVLIKTNVFLDLELNVL